MSQDQVNTDNVVIPRSDSHIVGTIWLKNPDLPSERPKPVSIDINNELISIQGVAIHMIVENTQHGVRCFLYRNDEDSPFMAIPLDGGNDLDRSPGSPWHNRREKVLHQLARLTQSDTLPIDTVANELDRIYGVERH